MVAKVFHVLHRLLLLVAVTVSLTATGFAHKMPDAQDQALAFALANGVTPDDFCGGAPDGSSRDAHCLACQITGSADLPPAATALIDLELALVACVAAAREARITARILDPAHSPQGPPSA
ncbi:MAG: hypothetical protein ACK4P8_02345 [Tabrizicola sp.]